MLLCKPVQDFSHRSVVVMPELWFRFENEVRGVGVRSLQMNFAPQQGFFALATLLLERLAAFLSELLALLSAVPSL